MVAAAAGSGHRWILDHLRDIPDFPEPGVVFKDITPLLGDADAFARSISALADATGDLAGERPVDLVIGVEARGFVFGAPVAVALGAGFVPFRKPGKLPYETVEHTYELEYGTDTLSAHVDAVAPGQRVVLIDDVLATGGTAAASLALVDRLGAEVVGAVFLLELGFLSGRARLGDTAASALVTLS